MPLKNRNIPLTLELINFFYWASIGGCPLFVASHFFGALFPVFMPNTKKQKKSLRRAAELKDIESLSQVVTHKRGRYFVTGKRLLAVA